MASSSAATSGHERVATSDASTDTAMQHDHRPTADADESSPNTPTRHTFGGMLAQRPLPDEPLSMASSTGEHTRSNDASRQDDLQTADVRTPQDSNDVDMGEADDDENGLEDDASDNDSITSDSQRPSKKKKGQRFFCTDYPPCQLSFTRSEHLARHIRKHTGERPFQCHCSRRFSRLDNLRQHAQTVHVNEDIPGDSLAATSTRFQRQIRTDRVRPAGSRSRASTIGSQGGHGRGHSRNLSASSIASTASTMSIAEDIRRRPQPLAIAGEGSGRTQLSVETYGNGVLSNAGPQHSYYNQSPTGYSTPLTNFSPVHGSPRFQSGMASPSSTARSSIYGGMTRTHNRRLSVPSTSNPYQPQPPVLSYQPSHLSPVSSHAFSPNGSAFASPTSSVFSHERRESETEMEYRRRTWHASSHHPQYMQRPATSGLTYHQTPDEPRPAFSQQPAASQLPRLPGIESFDIAPPPAVRQQPSPMMTDDVPRPTSSGRLGDAAGLHHGLTRLDITTANAPTEHQWQPSQPNSFQSTVQRPPPPPPQYVQSHHMSMPEQSVTPRKLKRNAWYGGPVTPSYVHQAPQGFHRPSPEDSGSSEGVQTPAMSHASEHHPTVYNPSSQTDTYPAPVPSEEQKVYYAAHQQPKPEPVRADSGFQTFPPDSRPPSTYALQTGHDPRFAQTNQCNLSDSARLDALVTVALNASDSGRAAQPSS